MKLLKGLVLSLIFLVSLFAPLTSFAQGLGDVQKISLPVDPFPQSYFGQDHGYSVNFRGNGEAVITLRAILTNETSEGLSKINLRVPNVIPSDFAAYQVLRDPICIQYENVNYPLPVNYTQKCIKYQDPNYFDYYLYGATYKKAKVELVGDTIQLTLPNTIKKGASGSYLLYIRAFGFTKKSITGEFNYNFETLKINEPIRNLNVGINVDSDMYLKGAVSKTNYRYEESVSVLKSSGEADLKSSQLDSIYSQIGSGDVNKFASNLAPFESYSVKGSYADSRFKLYGKEILLGLSILLGLILLVILITKKLSTSKSLKQNSVLGGNVIVVVGVSFASAFLSFCYTVLVYFLGKNASSILGPYSNYDFQGIMFFLIVIVSIAIYGLFLVTPSIFVAIKKGWVMGIVTFFATILWLVLFISILLGFILIFGNFRNDIYPTPIYKTMESSPQIETLSP